MELELDQYQSILDGDEKAFESFFHQHYQALVNYCNRMIQDIAASEDLVQQFFVTFWEKRQDLELKTNLVSYFYRSIHNRCLNELKHLKVKESYKQHNELERKAEETQLDQDENESIQHRVQLAINTLPEKRKKIFLMSKMQGMKYSEIASDLNISVKTVENQMGTALKHLRSELKNHPEFIILFILSQNIHLFQ